MLRTFFRSILILAGAATLTLACMQEEEPTRLSIGQTEIFIPTDGGTQKIPFVSNKPWTASSSAAWCIVNPTSGSESDMSTTVTADANSGTETRIATITVKAGDQSKDVTITQLAADPEDPPVTPEGVKGWEKTVVKNGIILWSFEGLDPVSNAMQSVHVADVDLTQGYGLKYVYDANKDICSNIMKKHDAIVSMNGGFGASQIFIKVDGTVHKNITKDKNDETGVMNWRNDGAICAESTGKVFIANAIFSQDGDGQSEYGEMVTKQRDYYTNDLKTVANIISGSPLLIYEFEPLGLTYVPAGVNPQTYASDTEHPWYHQGVRHPRTAIGITGNNHLIMLVVDGRLTNCKGFTAKELTQFLITNFNPKYALNLDGGGSSTLCVAGCGDPSTHVVNYPCDNGKKDHAGERTVQTFFYIK